MFNSELLQSYFKRTPSARGQTPLLLHPSPLKSNAARRRFKSPTAGLTFYKVWLSKSIPPDHFPLFAKMSSTNLRLLRGRLAPATLRNEYEPKPNQNRIRKSANRAQSKPSATNAKLTQIPLSTLAKGSIPHGPRLAKSL